MAASTHAATTAFLDFQQTGQFSNYFNGDSNPVWSQSSSAGIGALALMVAHRRKVAQ